MQQAMIKPIIACCFIHYIVEIAYCLLPIAIKENPAIHRGIFFYEVTFITGALQSSSRSCLSAERQPVYLQPGHL
jgi:hypothetical protein